MTRQPESTKGTQAGKNRLELPNNAELNQMTDEELSKTLGQLRELNMTVKGKESQGLTPPGGNMREIRKTVARIITIQQKRGRKG